MTMTTEVVKGRKVELETIELEPIRVRILPDGRMDRQNAATYLGKTPKTLAMWFTEGKGPRVHKAGGRCFYYRDECDAYLKGESPSDA